MFSYFWAAPFSAGYVFWILPRLDAPAYKFFYKPTSIFMEIIFINTFSRLEDLIINLTVRKMNSSDNNKQQKTF